MEIELSEREKGINLRITDPTSQRFGSLTAKKAISVYFRHNSVLESARIKNANNEAIVRDKKMMVGDPCYQAYRSIDYFQKFNNYGEEDRKNTKILLNLPMIRREMLNKVTLNHDIGEKQQESARLESLISKRKSKNL